MGQLPATEQQSPLAQQNPFWQWAPAQSESSSQEVPLPWSGTQTASQWALAMHCESSVQAAAHTGGVWVSWPSQKRSGKAPQLRAIRPVVQPRSSLMGAVVPHWLLVHVASVRDPWQVLLEVQAAAER